MSNNGKAKIDEIHIGSIVKAQVECKGIKVSWLAQRLHCHRNNVYKIFEKQWIDSLVLLKLCFILDYDFFAVFSQYYQENRNK